MMRIIHVTCILKTKGECWQGDGFWDLPPWDVDRMTLTEPIQKAIWEGVKPLIDLNCSWSIKLQGQEYELKGPMEAAMLRRCNGMGMDDPKRVTWHPTVMVTWALEGGG